MSVFVVFVVFPERSKHEAVRKQPGKGQTGYCGNMRAVTTLTSLLKELMEKYSPQNKEMFAFLDVSDNLDYHF